MTSKHRRLKPPLLGEVMRNLTENGDTATATRLKNASGLSSEPEERKLEPAIPTPKPKVVTVGKKDTKPRKHPYAYIYLNVRNLPENVQRTKLGKLVDLFLSKGGSKRKLFTNHSFVVVTLPGSNLVCAVRVDAAKFTKSKLAGYIAGTNNKHNLAVYLRKPRKDVQ